MKSRTELAWHRRRPVVLEAAEHLSHEPPVLRILEGGPVSLRMGSAAVSTVGTRPHVSGRSADSLVRFGGRVTDDVAEAPLVLRRPEAACSNPAFRRARRRRPRTRGFGGTGRGHTPGPRPAGEHRRALVLSREHHELDDLDEPLAPHGGLASGSRCGARPGDDLRLTRTDSSGGRRGCDQPLLPRQGSGLLLGSGLTFGLVALLASTYAAARLADSRHPAVTPSAPPDFSKADWTETQSLLRVWL